MGEKISKFNRMLSDVFRGSVPSERWVDNEMNSNFMQN